MSIIVYDYETTSKDANTTIPVQLAACTIDEVTLKINEEDIFNTHICPYDWTGIDENNETVQWHSKNRKMSPKELIEMWRAAPHISQVWPDFVSYCLKYNKGKNKWGAPIRAGMNIINFDDIITRRMHEMYGKGKVLFHPIKKIDLLDIFYLWFRHDDSIKSYSMDNMRAMFGLSSENAHDARKDILDTALIITRFLSLTEKTSRKVTFKGALIGADL